MQWLYRYPQAEYPYQQLREENARRGRDEREYELGDTGILDEDRFFDVTVTYAKAAPDDICITIEATNQGPKPAPLHVLPQLWFRNTWSWGRDRRRAHHRPTAAADADRRRAGGGRVPARLPRPLLPGRRGHPGGALLRQRDQRGRSCSGPRRTRTRYTKDGINNRVVHGDKTAVNPAASGTKAAFWYRFDAIGPGETVEVQLRLSPARAEPTRPSAESSTPSTPTGGRGRRVLRDRHPPGHARRGPPRRPARLRRAAVGQAALPLRRRPVAQGRSGRRSRRRRPDGDRARATRTGATSRWPTSSPCPTSGSTPGSRPGTSPSTRSRWPTSTRSSPRNSWC